MNPETTKGGSDAAPGSRLLKAACAECGYTVRVTRKWVAIAKPACPNHGQLAVEGMDEMPAAPPRPTVSAETAEWWAQRWVKAASPEELAAMREIVRNMEAPASD